ncbi:MAG: site-specific integrase [Nitrososphaeria archaeon]
MLLQEANLEKKLNKVLHMRVSLNKIAKFRNSFLSVKRWFEKLEENRVLPLDNNSSTVRHYLGYLIRFCRWVDKDPDTIIKERLEDKKSDNIEIIERYDRLVRLFSRGYKERGRPVAAREAVVALKSFFTKNSVPLSVKSPRKIVEKERSRLTIEEIKKLLRFCNVREKFIVSILFQTGGRPKSILLLKYGDIKVDFEAGNLPVRATFSIFDVKGQYAPYTTFFGKDTYQFLMDYLKLRELEGEKITDQSPLIRKVNRDAPETYAGLYNFCKKLTRLAYMLKINKKITPGTFRRTFQTIMEQHMPINWVDRLMGHVKFRGIQGEAYSQPTMEELAEAYKKAEPYISVSETNYPSNMGGEVLSVLARIFGVDLSKITREGKGLSLDLMTEEDINRLYDEFRRAIAFIQVPDKKNDPPSVNPRKILYQGFKHVPAKYKFKIANNDKELTGLLENGWELERELSGGKYLIKKVC